MTTPTAFIDPPTPFDTLATWRAYRDRLEALAKSLPDDKYVAEKLREAKAYIAAA